MSRYPVWFLVLLLPLFATCGDGEPTAPTPAPIPSPDVSLGATEQAAIAGTWSVAAPMPTARSEITSAVLDGKIYVVGGFQATGGNSDIVEVYDPKGDAWETITPLPVRLDHAMAASVDGKLYVMGGYRIFGQEISDATYQYDPVSDTWTERAPMPLGRAAGAAVTTDGLIYVLGGVGPEPAVGQVYDPNSDGWTSQFSPIAAPREHLTAQLVNRTIYVIGGRWQGVNVNTVEVLRIVPGGTWEMLAPMPTARGGLASAVVRGEIHVVGGEDLVENSTFAKHEVYDRVADGWTPAPPLPTPRHGLTAQAVGERLYVIGGGPQARLSTSALVEAFRTGD